MVKKNQYQFHRRMRRKCINFCKSQRDAGQLEDPVLAPVEKNGVTMAALRRLAELASQSASSGSNRAFGVFQEVREDGSHRSFVQSQGLESSSRSGISRPQFSICVDGEETSREQRVPWRRFEGVGVRSKENAVSRERWSEVRLAQQAGAVKKQAAPFAVYSEARKGGSETVSGLNRSVNAMNQSNVSVNTNLSINHNNLSINHNNLSINHNNLSINHNNLSINHNNLSINHNNLSINSSNNTTRLLQRDSK